MTGGAVAAVDAARSLRFALRQQYELAIARSEASASAGSEKFWDLDRAHSRAVFAVREAATGLASALARAQIHHNFWLCDFTETLANQFHGADEDLLALADKAVVDLWSGAEAIPGQAWIAGETPRRYASRPSLRLVVCAVSLLPATHRARYGEEFRAELADIAAVAPRRTQLAYGMRLFRRALALRRALRATQPAADRERDR